MNGRSKNFSKTFGGWSQAVLRIGNAFWATEVANENQAPAAVDDRFDAWQRHLNTAVVGDVQIAIKRYVEIDPHQDFFAANFNAINTLLRHVVLSDFFVIKILFAGFSLDVS